ncbi:Tetratricopeptide-like helical [Penicillium argentinense]|uniref:Tetratricopeptide-like helical n=1 Tax=Penicillium argentinense TaxID=1131581 RepID=A0A9W9KLH5_9EURO|nr:Tetratricopeptide-like helical [Penicillium argentinense]KAJ5110086.1 Tetratricopeptide-like helical [Penicillium argentinense]
MTNEYYDLGSYRFTVTTSSAECQTWFDRGYLWAQGFNHEEAAQCFIKAIKLDENCAMAYWGLCYSKGPNYNKAWIRFDPVDFRQTIEYVKPFLQKARDLAPCVSPTEAALILALQYRFPILEASATHPDSLNQDYAQAMCNVYGKYLSHLDISALCAEALMCISPRALWDLETGKPSGPHTVKARDIIERAMSLPGGPQHPALCHLYIHLMEMSPYPEVALPAADRLRSLMPDASHMLHMPTHIDIACGDYRRAVDSNHQAILSDDKFFARTNGSVLYFMYRAHNVSAKLYSALISGRYQEASSSAERLSEILTPDILRVSCPPMADWTESLLGASVHVMIRFGKWEDILCKTVIPDDRQLYCSTTAMIYYGRSIALAVLGRVEEAKVEQEKFEKSRLLVPRTRLNSVPVIEADLLCVASSMLRGEIQYREGDVESAFRSLREATALEDALPYADPPPWMQPTRHALGALLLEQGRTEEAEIVYREDLGLGGNLPRRQARLNNVWGLHGLLECLVRLDKNDEASTIRVQRDIALASADTPILASCFCRLSAVEDVNDASENCCQ